jgi:hypothetical protein
MTVKTITASNNGATKRSAVRGAERGRFMIDHRTEAQRRDRAPT